MLYNVTTFRKYFRLFIQQIFLTSLHDKEFFFKRQSEYAGTPAGICFSKDHLITNGRFSVFNFQTCFESSVSFWYFLLRSDFTWFLYRVLNSLAVTPMYVCILSLSVVVTSAWQTTLFDKHFLSAGHSLGRLQLQVIVLFF